MPSEQYIPVTASYRGSKIEFLAMLDTGNQLTDPLTGEPVLIVSKRIGSRLTGADENIFSDGVNAMINSKISGCRLIPYQAVGKERGFLLGIRCDLVAINGRNTYHMIAISPNDFGGGEFDGLAGRNYV